MRSWLKPDRAWDVPRPAGNRHRSPWWRKLLGGRDGQTRLQPGSCCGCTTYYGCASCNWPATLYLTDDAGTVTLTWDGVSSWTGCQALTVSNSLTACDCYNGGVTPASHSMVITYQVGTNAGNCYVQRGWTCCYLSGMHYCIDTFSGCTRLVPSCGVKCNSPSYDSGNLPNCTLPVTFDLSLGFCGTPSFGTLPSPFASGTITIQS